MRLTKPWLDSAAALALLHGNLGVFQLGDAQGRVVFIGYAGGNSKFGLQGAVREALAAHSDATSCLLYTSPSPRDQRGSRMPSSA